MSRARPLQRSARTDAGMLTPKEEAFARAYVLDPRAKNNASAAARIAGYQGKRINQTASETLHRPRVAQRVRELQAELADATAANAKNVVEAYRRASLLDPLGLLTPDESREAADGGVVYRVKRPDELTDEERGAIDGFELIESTDRRTGKVTQRIKYKIISRKDALDSLARTHGMFRDKVEHEHSHKVRALFEFVATRPETSELVARIRAKHGMVLENETKNCSEPSTAGGPKASG